MCPTTTSSASIMKKCSRVGSIYQESVLRGRGIVVTRRGSRRCASPPRNPFPPFSRHMSYPARTSSSLLPIAQVLNLPVVSERPVPSQRPTTIWNPHTSISAIGKDGLDAFLFRAAPSANEQVRTRRGLFSHLHRWHFFDNQRVAPRHYHR